MSHTFAVSQNLNLSLLCDFKIESIFSSMQQTQQHPAHQHGKVEIISVFFSFSLLNFAHTRL